MIGIICAMDVELSLLLEKLTDKEEKNILNYKFYKGKFLNNEVVLLRCGVGKVQSAVGTAIMIENFKPSFIINSGIAGGINGLKQYDVVLGKNFKYSDVDASGFGYKLGQVPGMPEEYHTDLELVNKVSDILNNLNVKHVIGNVLSADSFIINEKQLLVKYEGLTAVEMEGCSIAQVCYMTGTKFVSIRFISDVVGGSDQSEAYQVFEKKASNLSANICYNVCKTL
jgi:adenosylhomocysteine nucleosidase